MIVGLTGGIGSGKTTVLLEFKKFNNIAVYIADIEAKALMNSSNIIKNSLITEFGEEAYINNELNKSFISNIVFKNKNKLATLNSIVHPIVHQHFLNFIEENKTKDYILYENAILFENGSNKFCNKIVTVTAPIKLRIQRVLKRDNSTESDVLARINNQWSEHKKTIQSNYIIENIDFNETLLKVSCIHNKLTKILQ